METFCKLCESYNFETKSCKLEGCVYDTTDRHKFKKREEDLSDEVFKLQLVLKGMKDWRAECNELKKTIKNLNKELETKEKEKFKSIFGAFTITRIALIGNGIDTMEKLLSYSSCDLRKIKYFGIKSILIVEQILKSRGLMLGDSKNKIGK